MVAELREPVERPTVSEVTVRYSNGREERYKGTRGTALVSQTTQQDPYTRATHDIYFLQLHLRLA
jgi:hypothetical protein